jgi:hypothetical protein
LEESLSSVGDFENTAEIEREQFGNGLYIVLQFAVNDDPRRFVPRDKHDHSRAELAIAAGYPAVEPVLPELLEWLQDMNWPVAQTLEPFLSSIGLPLAPHVRRILETDDEIWKDWIILGPISSSRELAAELEDELSRIARTPTEGEKEEELDFHAGQVMLRYALGGT